MKKTILGWAILFALLSTSCSNEGTEKSVQVKNDSEELVLLKNSLERINTSFEVQPATRMKKWKRWLICALADVGGFIKSGSISDAATASRLAWDITKESKHVTDKSDTKAERLDHSLSDFKPIALKDTTENRTIGEVHNNLSIKLAKHFGNSIKEISAKDMIDYLNKSIQNNDSLRDKYYNTNSSPYMVELIAKEFDPNASVKENILKFKKLTSNEVERNLWDICGTVIEGLQNVTDDDTHYIQQVNNTVFDADLNPEIKEKILNCVSIAEYSARLWNTDILEFK